MENQDIHLQDIKAIIKRRKWSLIIPAVAVFLVTAAVAFLLPPIYKSSSTILIEDQEIPLEYVRTTVTSYVEKRLEEINQKIMSTSRLQGIIDKYGLYADLRDKETREEIVDKMRNDIHLDLISTDVVDRRTGRPTTATIAFTLSYEGKNDPAKVQRVASVLASLYLEENLKVRQRQVAEASKFFEGEIDKIKISLNKVEGKIAAFKEKHVHELPELLQINIQDMHKAELNIERFHEQLRGLKEKEGDLTARLAMLSPQRSDHDRLVNLKQELVSLQATYSDEYPDIGRLKAEIADLAKKIRHAEQNKGATMSSADNPAYVTLSSQLTSTRSEIETVRRQISEFEKQQDALNRKIAATPAVENAYRKLLFERDNMQKKVDELTQKFMEARVAQGLEKEQKGERFTLIDPALLPEKPYKPPRLAILLVGLILGIGAGVGFAALREFTDDAVRESGALSSATSVPVLAAIPLIRTAREKERLKRKRLTRALAAAAVVVVGLALFHLYVMDFAVVWAKVARRLSL